MFISAGGETFLNTTHRYMVNGLVDLFEMKEARKFFELIQKDFLISYGQYLNKRNHPLNKKKLNNKKYNKALDKTLNCNSFTDFRPDTNLYIDSGGYQVSLGFIDRSDLKSYMENFKEFLCTYKDKYYRSFVLDLIFTKDYLDFEDIKNLNKWSYNELAKLPREIKDKIIYVHHFRTPYIYEIWEELKHHMFDFASKISIGGIVMSRNMGDSSVLYVIPLITIIQEAMKKGLKKIDLHILGGSSFKDIFFYQLMKCIIKNTHNIDIEFSYDSSGAFKGIAKGRLIPTITNDSVQLLCIREDMLDKKIGNVTVRKYLANEFDRLLQIIGSNKNHDGVFYKFNPKFGRTMFTENTMICSIMYYCLFYKELEQLCIQKADEIYSEYFVNNDCIGFNNAVFDFLIFLNEGSMTDNQKKKSYSIYNSLKLLEDLDENKCKTILDKYTSNSEILQKTDLDLDFDF